MWAESKWIRGPGEWLEVRANAESILGSVARPESDIDDSDPRYHGIYSIVVGGNEKIRALPSLYLGPDLVLVHRDITRVLNGLDRVISVTLDSYRQPTFALTAARIDGRIGLYARDSLGRARFRRYLVRRGSEFSSDPFVYFRDGYFMTEEFGQFSPEFIVFRGDPNTQEGLVDMGRGFVLWVVAGRRLGRISPDELSGLSPHMKKIDVVRADDPDVAFRALTEGR